MQNKAKNLTYLRASNQGAILKALLYDKYISKQDLASRLNLTPMSISYITADLIEKGVLREVAGAKKITKSPGRRASLIALNENKILAIGVTITKRHLRTSLVSLNGEIIKCFSHRHDKNTTSESLTEKIISDIELLLNEVKDNILLGIGVNSIGIVDIKNKSVISIIDLCNIHNWKIGKDLEERFNLSCYVVDDMKASALAESYYGVAKGLSDFIYLGITYGLGSSIISNGTLFEGNMGFGGEVGHTTLYHNGKTCECGNRGCAELYLSAGALLEKSGLKEWQDFLDYCNNSPENPVIREYMCDLTTFLVNIINTFDPQAVVIGHEGAPLFLNNAVFNQVNKNVNQRIISRNLKSVPIVPSTIYDKIHELNAASVVFSHLFNGEFKL